MPRVLTTNSQVVCDAGSDTGTPPSDRRHGGRVSTTSSAKLKVNDAPVLTAGGIGPAVSSCETPLSSPLKPCSSVTIATGQATKLTAAGTPVMLDSLSGTTDGFPPGTVPASANQNKLTAV
jgi:hypothetical protein